MTSLHIPVLLGTSREGRKSEWVARWLIQYAEHVAATHNTRLATPLIDVRSFPMEQDVYASDASQAAQAWVQTMAHADGLIIVSPEYNHGYPGRLKEVLDIAFEEYFHKPVGLVSVSSGRFGGARVIENLLPVVRELGMYVAFKDLTIANVNDAFNDQGELVDESLENRADAFFKELIWLASVLQQHRAEHLEDAPQR